MNTISLRSLTLGKALWDLVNLGDGLVNEWKFVYVTFYSSFLGVQYPLINIIKKIKYF